MPKRAIPVALHLVGALSFAGWLTLAVGSRQAAALLPAFLVVTAWAWLGFLTVWRLCRHESRAEFLGPLLGWAVAFRLAGLVATPVLDDDYWRFLWDGRQLALTGNPYATAPAAHFADEGVPERFREVLDHINYPHVPTIYGPVCQAAFALGFEVAPGRLWPWKLIVTGADLAALWLMYRLVRRRPEPGAHGDEDIAAQAVIPVLIVGWCPTAVFETSFNAHPEMVGIVLLIAAMFCWQKNALGACAVFCGWAVAAKLFAVFLVPFLLGRRGRAWGVFALVLAGCYAPFWWQGSLADWSGLRAFASEWEFNPSVYALVKMLVGPLAARWVCGGVFGVIWLALLGRWLADRHDVRSERWPPGAIVFGALLALSTTVNPWYLLWMLPFVALRPSLTALSALALVNLSYLTGLNLGDPRLGNFEHPAWVRLAEYGGILIALAMESWRSFPTRRCPPGRSGVVPLRSS